MTFIDVVFIMIIFVVIGGMKYNPRVEKVLTTIEVSWMIFVVGFVTTACINGW